MGKYDDFDLDLKKVMSNNTVDKMYGHQFIYTVF